MIIKLDDRQIELPDNLDNVSGITVAYKKPSAPLYAIVQYCCQQNKPYKILEYHVYGKDILNDEDKRVWEWCPSMNFSVVEDGFTCKKEAEARLKNCKRSSNK